MNVAIRVDASFRIGSGHIVRCLALAEGMRQRGLEVCFLCQSLPGNLITSVKERGFVVHPIPAISGNTEHVNRDFSVPHSEWLGVDWLHDATLTATALSAMRSQPDWLVVDHYALDKRWELAVKRRVRRILVIDDLANRQHECDILLDQVCTNSAEQYSGLVPEQCHLLLGAHYVLLRPEFAEMRSKWDIKNHIYNPKLVHVFFGTSDELGHTVRFSRILLENFSTLRLRIAAGKTFRHPKRILDLSKDFPGRVEWEHDVANMAQHMYGCNIAVGTPGMSTWERACMGLPAAHLTNSDSQVKILGALRNFGFCDWLGSVDVISNREFINGMTNFLGDDSRLSAMRQKGLATIDGHGVQRTVNELTNLSL